MKTGNKNNTKSNFLTTVFVTTLLLFVLLAWFVHVNPQNNIDHSIQDSLHPLATSAGVHFLIQLTFLGSFNFLFPAYVIFVAMYVWQKKAWYGLHVAGLALSGFLSVQLFKQIFQRHRPPMALIPNVTDYSFPSGHSTSSLIFCSVMAYSLWHSSQLRWIRMTGLIFFSILPISIGLSRIVLTVHYPTDVAAGFCFGTLWVIVWYKMVQKRFARHLPVFSGDQ